MFKRLLKLWFVPLDVHEKLIEDYEQTLELLKRVQEDRDHLATGILKIDAKLRRSEAFRDHELERFKVEMKNAQNALATAANTFEKYRERFLELRQDASKESPALSESAIQLEGDEAVRQAIAELAQRNPSQKLN